MGQVGDAITESMLSYSKRAHQGWGAERQSRAEMSGLKLKDEQGGTAVGAGTRGRTWERRRLSLTRSGCTSSTACSPDEGEERDASV